MHTFFEKIQLGLTNAHLAIHAEKALTSIIERVETDGLEGKVFRVATEKVKGFGFAFLRMELCHRSGGTS